jgi:hypothetical protein
MLIEVRAGSGRNVTGIDNSREPIDLPRAATSVLAATRIIRTQNSELTGHNRRTTVSRTCEACVGANVTLADRASIAVRTGRLRRWEHMRVAVAHMYVGATPETGERSIRFISRRSLISLAQITASTQR